jgi:hypothetical protein
MMRIAATHALTRVTTALIAAGMLSGTAMAADSLADAVTGGKFSADIRYRYELVDKDNTRDDAKASTIRTRMGWQTDTFHGFGAMLEFENISLIGSERYDDNTGSGNTDYQVVADPIGTEVEQAFLSYVGVPDTEIRYGRQRVNFDNQRFIGAVGFRQNDMTHDAATIVNKSLPDTTLIYGYVFNVNTILGTDLDTSTHLLNASYAGIPFGTLTGYAYLLDVDDNPAISSSTYGLRFTGAPEIGNDMKLPYGVEYARQTDRADNPANFSHNYLLGEIGIQAMGVTAKVGHERLEGNGGTAFQTPLATGHAFNGWADMFLSTPATGLHDTYLSVGAKPLDIDVLVVYHDFSSDEGSIDYGTEWNLKLAKSFMEHYSVSVEYADYNADDVFAASNVDTRKTWLTLQAKF